MQITLRRALTGATVGAMLLAGTAVAAQARGSGDDRSSTSVTRSTEDRGSSETRQQPAATSQHDSNDLGSDDSATRNDHTDHDKRSGIDRDDSSHDHSDDHGRHDSSSHDHSDDHGWDD
jgi:hypothetical protein